MARRETVETAPDHSRPFTASSPVRVTAAVKAIMMRLPAFEDDMGNR